MCSSIQVIVGPLSPDSPDIKKSRRVDMTLSTSLDFLISGLSGEEDRILPCRNYTSSCLVFEFKIINLTIAVQ